MASSQKIIILAFCLILSSSLLVEGFFKGHGNRGMSIAAILAAGLIAKLLDHQHHQHHGCHHHHSAASHLHQRIVALRNPYAAESQNEQKIAAIYHRLAESQKLQSTSQLKFPQLQQGIPQFDNQKIADLYRQDTAESQLEQKIAAIRRIKATLAASKQQQRIAQLQQSITEIESPQLDESFRRGQY